MNLPRIDFFAGYDKNYPLLCFDIYKHRFVFVTVKSPKEESGFCVMFSFFRMNFSVVFTVEKPYEVSSKFYQKLREKWHNENNAE